MRLLLLNPNTTSVLTDRMMTAAERVRAPTTQIAPLTAPRGVPYIATRAEAQIAGAIALEMLPACHDQHDAVIIAGFGDPGLASAMGTVYLIAMLVVAVIAVLAIWRPGSSAR